MEELDQTKSITAEFGRPGGVGEKLQRLLEKRAEEKDNWVSILLLLSILLVVNINNYFDSFLTGGVGWLILATDCRL